MVCVLAGSWYTLPLTAPLCGNWKSFSSESVHAYRLPASANATGDTASITAGNWPEGGSCLAYAVRSWVGETSFLTTMSGFLSVTRLMAASQYCGVRFGVSKTRKVISFLPVVFLVLLLLPTEHAVSPAAAVTVARASANTRFIEPPFVAPARVNTGW